MDKNKKYEGLRLEEIQKLVIETYEMGELYEFQLLLARKIGNLTRRMEFESDPERFESYRSSMRWATNIFNICQKRQEDLKLNEFYIKFHNYAKETLDSEAYNNILMKVKINEPKN